jgi:hypothetical protein
MSWGKRTICGQEYDLAHLDSFTMQVTPKRAGAPTYDVRVVFGCHTFTKEWEADDPPGSLVDDDGDQRCFCTVRYGHSLHLPQIMLAAATGKVHFSNNSPYLIIRQLAGVNGPYAVYFDAMKAGHPALGAVVNVRSAHAKPNVPMDLPRIGFATMVDLIVTGRPIKPPKK